MGWGTLGHTPAPQLQGSLRNWVSRFSALMVQAGSLEVNQNRCWVSHTCTKITIFHVKKLRCRRIASFYSLWILLVRNELHSSCLGKLGFLPLFSLSVWKTQVQNVQKAYSIRKPTPKSRRGHSSRTFIHFRSTVACHLVSAFFSQVAVCFPDRGCMLGLSSSLGTSHPFFSCCVSAFGFSSIFRMFSFVCV